MEIRNEIAAQDIFRQRAIDCECLFLLACKQQDQSQQPDKVLQELSDQHSRFKIWCGNLDAVSLGHRSLDWRLRDADILRPAILDILDDVKYELDNIIQLISKTATYLKKWWKSKKIAIYLSSLISSIDYLYKFGVRVRNHRPDCFSLFKALGLSIGDQETELELSEDFNNKYEQNLVEEWLSQMRRGSGQAQPKDDKNGVEPYKAALKRQTDEVGNEKPEDRSENSLSAPITKTASMKTISYHPLGEDSPSMVDEQDKTKCIEFQEETAEIRVEQRSQDKQLIQLLSRAITTRRRQFACWQKRARRTTRATKTEVSALLRKHAEESLLELELDQMSDLSLTSIVGDLDDDNAVLPEPPKISSAGENFVCPYCFVLCPGKDGQGKRWRKHILEDLEPYMCSYIGCPTADELYANRSEWIAHENATHRPSWWCRLHPEKPFTSKTSYEDHLHLEHSNLGEELIGKCVQSGSMPLEDTREFCHICLRKVPYEHGEKAFMKHIAHHFETIAALAAPCNAIIDDDLSADDSHGAVRAFGV